MSGTSWGQPAAPAADPAAPAAPPQGPDPAWRVYDDAFAHAAAGDREGTIGESGNTRRSGWNPGAGSPLPEMEPETDPRQGDPEVAPQEREVDAHAEA
jgi:hypothetical protein